MLICLAKEGGVKFLALMLVKAVSPTDLGSPDTSNIQEWTYHDILKMPTKDQEDWKHACHVYELVDLPKDRKVIKNWWVFHLKLDG